MRFRIRYSLATFLLLPLLAGVGIKLYRGPHEYSLLDEHEKHVAEATARDPLSRYIIYRPRSGTFWAYRNLGGRLTRHGPENSVGVWDDKRLVEYRNGKQHGEYRVWDADGALTCEGQCDHDLPAGEWIFYSKGVVYRRVRYDNEAGREVESRYRQGKLAGRQITTQSTGAVDLTAWHANGVKRLEGHLIKNQPDGVWLWWDTKGRRVRRAEFRAGIPLELADRPGFERFFASGIEVDFSEVPLQLWLDVIGMSGFRIEVEANGKDATEIHDRLITTVKDVPGPLAFFLALRDVGLTLDIRADNGRKEVLVILPVNSK